MDKSGFSVGQVSVDVTKNGEDSKRASDIYLLNAFRLVNFKAFRDTDWIKINRLTLLLGDNSSGKSALYQALVMLSAAYEYLMQEEKFTNLAKLAEEVGDFEDICNKSGMENTVKIGFRFLRKGKMPEYWVHIAKSETDEFGKVVKVAAVWEGHSIDILPYYDSVNLFFLERKDGLEIPKEISTLAGSMLASLREFAKQFQIVAAHRYRPERFMQLTGSESGRMAASGSNAYELLFFRSEILGEKLYMVEDWLNKFGYTYFWKMSGVNRGQFILRELKTGIESNLADNGFGISQSLPLALALDMLAGKTLLVDSPEAFLQTKMQSEMGDLLIGGAGKGNVLVETGSEYLTLRIRRRVAEGVIPKEAVSFYYLEETEEKETACIEIKLDDNGEFQNIPESFARFFSSDIQDIERLDEISRDKRKQYAAKDCNYPKSRLTEEGHLHK